jgi:NADH-ubiquinone oxidoreductase chain 4
MGTPFSANFVGEFLSLSAGFQILPIVSILAATSIILSAAYSIYFYNRITGGIKSDYLVVTKDINRREFFILLPLIILTILIGILPNFILDDLILSLSNIITKIL